MSKRFKSEVINPKLAAASREGWGETAVLLITSHGLVIKEEDEEDVETFTVPEGITIKRALVSAPGECNIASETDVNGYVSEINAFMRALTSNRESTQNDAITRILNTVRRIDEEDLRFKRMAASEYERAGTEDESDAEHADNYRRYIQQFEKGFTRITFNEGDQILNKKFSRTNEQASKNDWVIKAMSVPGQPDLMAYLRPQTRFGDTTLTLEEIIHFLISKGVSNIIIFDLSCSNIATPDHTEYSQRDIRSLRKKIRKEGYGGKKTKRTKRYNVKKGGKAKRSRRTRKHYKK